MPSRSTLLKVAVPVPLPDCFDYLAPPDAVAARGMRVRVPFGRRRLVGVVVGEGVPGDVPRERIKPVLEVLDEAPLIDEATLGLLEWAARYYHHPLGEVIETALPVLLRQGRPAARQGSRGLRLTASGRDTSPDDLRRAPRQASLLVLLHDHLAGHIPSPPQAGERVRVSGDEAEYPLPSPQPSPKGRGGYDDEQVPSPPQAGERVRVRGDEAEYPLPSPQPSPKGRGGCSACSGGLGIDALDAAMPGWRPAARALIEKGLAEYTTASSTDSSFILHPSRPELNAAQQAAVDTVLASSGFGAFLLHGVTGSGKTEVYLRLAEEAVARGKQVLVLVPEIGLAPQIVERFRARIATPVAVLHSGLAEGERLDAWLAARAGEAGILIGTRSAVFAPLARPSLIIVDEEHDASFKQQDGFRYSARDLAVVRAHREGVPVVLGSATPSLESLANCARGAWRLLRLPERAGAGRHPAMRLVDTRVQKLDEGLSPPLVAAIRRTLDANGQVLLFINRRGYAPILRCDHCGWQATCARCDARMTIHGAGRRMRCHHCGATRPAPERCPDCGAADGLRPLGQGTERVEDALTRLFPDGGVVRIDRDSMRGKDKFERTLAAIHDGTHRILVGTQMLAKGHHFPEVTLAAILDADQGLFSPDFRGTERMAQLVTQVAGRAGREGAPGEVIIQTRQPDHPLLQLLLERGYDGFAEAALAERRAIGMPPYASLALLRAESPDARAGQAFLDAAKKLLEEARVRGVDILGPAPAPMERRAGKVRAQLLLRAANRADLQRLLNGCVERLYGLPETRRVRWSLDVDPQEMD